MKLNDLIEKMEEILSKREGTLRKKSSQSYRSLINQFSFWATQENMLEMEASEFDYIHAQNFLNSGRFGWTQSTRNKYKIAFNSFFAELVNRRLVAENPFTKIKPIRNSQTDAKKAMPVKIQERIKAHCIETGQNDLLFFIEFMFYTLIRPNEIRLLKVGDIDIEGQKICVNGRISKNKKTEYVGIPESFIGSLAKFIGRRSANMYLFGNSTPIGTNTMNRRHKKILDMLNISSKDYSVYSWKHTGASEFYKKEKDILALMRHCRHSDVRVTYGYVRSLGHYVDEKIMNQYPSF